MNIRTRFAPSPTGFLHVGGIRTALFAHLLARQAGGEFILRFEDTDKKREVPGSAEHLMTSLRAIGIEYDEGPDIGGPFAPYIQSERLDHYKKYAEQLIAAGRAYADPFTSEEVQRFRDEATAAKKPFLYRNHRPENPPAWDGTTPLRFKSDPKAYQWHDEVMGDLSTGPEVIDDFILIKTDGYPTYNFAHIIDDLEMEITHIIRGQEFISSMPNYLNLYEALGFDMSNLLASDAKHERIARALGTEGQSLSLSVGSREPSLEKGQALPPIFAHMPHIMNEQGNKKLGKRDGAKDVLDYIRDGYLPEALMSFIATLGWNDGTEQEVFTHDELVAKFSLAKVQRSGARFDEKRLLWVNGQFIRELSIDELYNRAEDFWPSEAAATDPSYKKQVLALAQARLKTLADLRSFGYFFAEPKKDQSLVTENKMLAKLDQREITNLVAAAHDKLASLAEWNADAIQNALNELLEQTGQKPGVLFSLIRVYTTWAAFSPELPATLALLGKDTTLNRLRVTLQTL